MKHMKRILVLILALVCSSAFAVDLGADFPSKGFARGDALNAKFDALNDGKIDATGTANITGSITVTGKTTTGTLESGAATFTKELDVGGTNQVGEVKTPLNSQYLSLASGKAVVLGANTFSNDSSQWDKYVDASASAFLYLDASGLSLYKSDAGNASPSQYGPYSLLHSGGSNVVNQPDSDGTALILQQGAQSTYLQYRTSGTYYSLAGSGRIATSNLAGSGDRDLVADDNGLVKIKTSDQRLKTDVQQIVGAVDKVRALRGVTYRLIGSANRDIGVIAQEIQQVIPEVVKTNHDGVLSVQYGNLTALLIEAMKQQQTQIESLESRINALEGK